MMEMGEQGRGKIRGSWGEQEQGAMGNRRRKGQKKKTAQEEEGKEQKDGREETVKGKVGRKSRRRLQKEKKHQWQQCYHPLVL